MLDNRRVAEKLTRVYYSCMTGIKFQQRVIEAMEAHNMSKAALSRKAGVSYHTIDKFLKRHGATTSSDNAVAIADALKINVDSDAEYEELRGLYYSLSEERRRFLIETVRGLVASEVDQG